MNPLTLLSSAPYIALAFLLATGGAYFKGHSDGVDSAEGQIAREERVARIAHDAALAVTGKAIAGIEVKNTTIRQATEKVIHENIVYRECRHTADSVQLINAALTGRTEPAGAGQLPRPDAAQ